MMRNDISRKLVSVLVVALLMFFFAGTAVSKEAKVKDVAGTISAIRLDSGQVAVAEKESGRTVTLTAGSDVDLKGFSVGDQVVIVYSPDMSIKSITKHGE